VSSFTDNEPTVPMCQCDVSGWVGGEPGAGALAVRPGREVLEGCAFRGSVLRLGLVWPSLGGGLCVWAGMGLFGVSWTCHCRDTQCCGCVAVHGGYVVELAVVQG